MRKRHKFTRNSVEFDELLPDGREIHAVAYGRVHAPDHTGRMELTDLELEVYLGDEPVEPTQLEREWLDLVRKGEALLFEDFTQGRRSA